mmetsp:Transcript_9610/g.13423  ORF Transcript_9610/g.13423 Transcript_9610/m.13423 type:complete len:656 (-) Transcript_9610:280-2247(-)
MIAQEFEIKVAILGHVSVGKTTVLNALFQDNFSEVSMRRTTAGINYFRVSFNGPKHKQQQDQKSSRPQNYKKKYHADDEDLSVSSAGTSDDSDKKTAKQTLDEITADNSILREKNIIQEKHFNINIDESFLKMRDDTHLVLVDIPGVNEAGSSKLYLDYVKDSWDNFDCVVVVMDAVQGVNTEEQVKLLEFVKENQDEQKEVPLIILVNKVDDPEDKEVGVLVDEVRVKVEQIFNVPDRKKQLNAILNTTNMSPQERLKASPAFIPISAENGFLYRAASRLQLSEFSMLDMDYIDKIGCEELGRFKWRKLSREEKYEAVYEVVSNPAEYRERLAASNFDKFLSTLEFFVGGEKAQECIIEKQLRVALKKLSSKNDIAENLSGIYDKCKVLGKRTGYLKDRFWELFEDCQDDAMESFRGDPKGIAGLHKPMEELLRYSCDLRKKLHCSVSLDGDEANNDDARIIEAMKGIIKQQCEILVEKEAEWKPGQNLSSAYKRGSWKWRPYTQHAGVWHNSSTGEYNADNTVHPEGDKPEHWKWNVCLNKWVHTMTGYSKYGPSDQNPANVLSWNNMSPRDWSTAISSILLMTHSKHFCENFGQQIADLQWLVHTPDKFNSVNRVRNQQQSLVGVNLKVPDSPSDPNHWGHIVWMFCEYMDN